MELQSFICVLLIILLFFDQVSISIKPGKFPLIKFQKEEL